MKTKAFVMALLLTSALLSESAIAEGTNTGTYRDVNEMEASCTANPVKFAKDATEYLKTLDVNNIAQAAIGVNLYDRIMNKPFPDDDVQASDWVRQKQEFIRQSMALSAISTNKAQILRIAQFLGEVRSKRIPGYSPLNFEKTQEARVREYAKHQLQTSLRCSDWLLTRLLLGTLQVLKPRDDAFIKQVLETAHLPPEYGVTFRDVPRE